MAHLGDYLRIVVVSRRLDNCPRTPGGVVLHADCGEGDLLRALNEDRDKL